MTLAISSDELIAIKSDAAETFCKGGSLSDCPYEDKDRKVIWQYYFSTLDDSSGRNLEKYYGD